MILNGIDLPRDILRQAAERHSQRFFNRPFSRAFQAASAGETTTIDLYDEIGFFGVSALDFRKKLNDVATPKILLRINSPGGDVFDGIAIHNDLAAHPAEITAQITGVAASAASVVAMAGDRIEMFDNAFLMIHNAWGLAIGDRNDMRSFADILEQIDGALAATYAARTGKPAAQIGKLMDAETWMNGAAAVKEGFADATVAADEGSAGTAAAARFDLSGFRNLPAALRRAVPDSPAPARPATLIAADERAALEGLLDAFVS